MVHKASIVLLLCAATLASAAGGLYNLTAHDIYGVRQDLGIFSGNVTLVIYNQLKVYPFQVFGMPCNQFASQEPDSNSEILAHVRSKFNVTFAMFAKLNVNSPCAETDPNMCSSSSKICCTPSNPIYAYLKSVFPGNLGWNYEKFLVGKDGIPVKRYGSLVEPKAILPDIKRLLGQ